MNNKVANVKLEYKIKKKCNKMFLSILTLNSMYMLTYYTYVMYFNALHLPHNLSTYNVITLGVTHGYRVQI